MAAELLKFLISAAKRYKTSIWKTFVGMADEVQVGNVRFMAEFTEKFKNTGVYTLTKEQRPLLKAAIENKSVTDQAVNDVARNVKGLTDWAHGFIRQNNIHLEDIRWNFDEATGTLKRVKQVRPTGYIENYFPHMLKRDISELLFEDANKIYNETRRITNVAETEGVSEVILNDMIRKRMGLQNGFRRETMQALDHIIARNPGMNHAQALRILHNRASSTIYNPVGFIEKARKGELPEEFYESDPVQVFLNYGWGWSRRMAEAGQWGAKYERLQNLMLQAAPDEAKDMEKIASFLSGKAEKGVPYKWRKAINLYTEFEVTTKIGMGTAVIPNLTQATISIIPKAGVFRVLRGTARLFTEEGRQLMRRSGVLQRSYTALSLFSGNPRDAFSLHSLDLHSVRGWEKLSRILTGVTTAPFNVVNRALNAVSASVGEVYIKDLYRIANRSTGARQSWAMKQLEVLRINPAEPLTEGKILDGMLRFTVDAQLQKNVLADPIWMNDPRFRWLALFKRFGYRQFTYVKDRLFMDELIHGKNIFPMLRLGVGSVAGGEFVNWSKDAIGRELFNSPERWKDEDRTIFEHIVDNITAVGMIGTFTDLARLDRSSFQKAWESGLSNGFFAIEPIAAAEIFGIPGSATRRGWPALFKDFGSKAIKEESLVAAWEGVRKAALPQISPLAGMMAAGIRAREKRMADLIRAYKKRKLSQ